MAKRKSSAGVGRRGFLKGAALAGAAAAASPISAQALTQAPAKPRGVVPMPVLAAEVGTPKEEAIVQSSGGSDFMVDVIKSLGVEYLAANPGTSFRALHESVINYGKNEKPEFITCTHEELSVGVAHGYAKAEGKPILVCAHGTVGLQHASMALYNAWCDRVPIYMMIGNSLDATSRGASAVWAHSVQDAVAMVRDFTKWDDTPHSLQHFAESAIRAYKIATTPPFSPAILTIDTDLQEKPIPEGSQLSIPKLPATTAPVGDPAALADAAKMLVEAENPLIIVDRTGNSPAGVSDLVALAETLQCPVIDAGSRMNFPTRHPLNHTDRRRGLVTQADVILGLECQDFYNTINSYHDHIEPYSTPNTKKGAKIITLTAGDLYSKSNYQDFMRFQAADLAIAADGEASLPYLTEAVKRFVNDEQKPVFEARGKKLAAQREQLLVAARNEATWGWDASPISTARLCSELWALLENEDYCLSSTAGNFISAWPQRLWDMKNHYNYLGSSGGFGIGYCAPSAVGAALANKKHGRFTVSINPDGDMMYGPGILWTAAHHRVPILYVMHNNRAYAQEIMGIQRMANRHQRGIDRNTIGTSIDDPNISYAKVAEGMGVYGEGPITDPVKLGPALQRAVAIVKQGHPALVDVVTQPR
jgi:acetolactate synthase I/II/III large subunit